MQLKSTSRRAAALLAGVLGGAALIVLPAATGLSAAHAAAGPVDYTCDITMSGGFASYGGEKAATLTVDTDAPASVEVGESFTPALSLSLTLDQAFADQFQPSPVNQMKAELTGTTTTGETAGTVPVTTATWQRGGGTGSPVPALTLTGTGSWGEVTPGDTGDLDLGLGALAGTLQMSTTYAPTSFTSYPMTCTPDGEDPVVDTVEVTEHVYNSTCNVDLTASGYGGKADYPADVELSVDAPETAYAGEAFDATVAATLTFGPAFVTYVQNSPVKKIAAVADAGSAPVTFAAWDRVLGAGSPIGQPIEGGISMTGTGTWAGIVGAEPGDLPLTVEGLDGDLTLTVVYGNATAVAPVVCTPGETAVPGTTSVEILAPAAMGTPVLPAVSGVRKVGSPLKVSTGSWTPADVALAYRWLRGGVAIPGATAASYTPVPADLGKALVAEVTASHAGYVTTTVTAAAGTVAAGAQQVVGTLKVTGTPKVGKSLAVKAGKATGATMTIQWLANGKAIAKATGAKLKLTKALKGKKVTVRVTWTRAGYAPVVQTSKALKIKK